MIIKTGRRAGALPVQTSDQHNASKGRMSENLLRPLPDILVRAVRLNASREMLSWVFAGKEYKRRAYGIISTRSSKWSCDRTERCKSVTQILTPPLARSSEQIRRRENDDRGMG